MNTPAQDTVPPHYAGKVTPWDLQKCMTSSGNAFIDARRTDAIEYAYRMKGGALREDLVKARHCLSEAIAVLDGQQSVIGQSMSYAGIIKEAKSRPPPAESPGFSGQTLDLPKDFLDAVKAEVTRLEKAGSETRPSSAIDEMNDFADKFPPLSAAIPHPFKLLIEVVDVDREDGIKGFVAYEWTGESKTKTHAMLEAIREVRKIHPRNVIKISDFYEAKLWQAHALVRDNKTLVRDTATGSPTPKVKTVIKGFVATNEEFAEMQMLEWCVRNDRELMSCVAKKDPLF